MDTVTLVNFILCLVILVMGCWAYAKKKGDVPLYIGIAFGLFAVSHLLTLLGIAKNMYGFLVADRVIAYLLVIFALYRVLAKK